MKVVNYTAKNAEGVNVSVLSLDFGDDIDRGVDFLNREHGGTSWTDKIDKNVLDITDPNVCICGQAFANHYSEGLERLGEHMLREGKIEHRDICEYGPDEPHDESLCSVVASDEDATTYGFCIPTSEHREYGREFARFLDLWASMENKDVYSIVDAAERWAWSSLTEQWVRRINRITNPLATTDLVNFVNFDDEKIVLTK